MNNFSDITDPLGGGHSSLSDSFEDLSRKWCDCKCWFVFDAKADKIYWKDFNCGSWGCEDCVAKLRWKWGNIIAWGTEQAHQLSRLRFLTLTGMPADDKRARQGFNNLNRDLRGLGYSFEYLGFNEISKGGMRHKHLLLHGDYLPQRLVSERAEANGLGKIVWITEVHNSQSVREYVTKYIGKNPLTWSGRKFSYSKGFFFGKTTREVWESICLALFGLRHPDSFALLTDRNPATGESGVYVPEYILERVPYNAKLSVDYAGKYYITKPSGSIERVGVSKKRVYNNHADV
jgi:hypothetical protein